MKKKHFIIVMISVLFIMVVAFIIYELHISKYGLETSQYTISSSELDSSFRIVQLTDLHDSVFGDSNSDLVAEVESASPDVIFITGDLVNSKTGEDTSIATDLISDLSKIAPVYFSYGNQEDSLEEDFGTDIRKLYSDAGATVLERDYVDTEINGQKVRIGGIYGYCQPVAFAKETHREDESEFLEEFEDTDLYTLLMCHMPVCWISSGSLYDWDIDCVFAGHAHGGQVRIPFIGGLWAPDQGWFPGQECGVYETSEDDWESYRKSIVKWAKEQKYDTSYYEEHDIYEPSYLVLSRGLGNTDKIPRFNNVPEIVVVDFIPE